MRKIEIIELIQDFLVGGDAPADIRSRYHNEIITKHVEAAYRDLIYEVWKEAKQYSDYSQLDGYSQLFTVSVSAIDTNNGTGDLPFPPVQLPRAEGVRHVHYTDDETSDFDYVDNNRMPTFASLEVDTVLGDPYFFIEKAADNENKIQLRNMADNTTDVSVRMIVPMSYMDDFDDVPLPAGKDGALKDMVIERLMGKPKEDAINDNVPNQL